MMMADDDAIVETMDKQSRICQYFEAIWCVDGPVMDMYDDEDDDNKNDDGNGC